MKWIGSSSLCRSYETTELHNYCVRDEMQNRKSTCAMAKEPKNALILERFRWDKIRQRLKTSHDVRDAVETVQPDDNFDKQLREYLLNKRSKNSNGKKCVDDRRINIDKDKGQLKLQATERKFKLLTRFWNFNVKFFIFCSRRNSKTRRGFSSCSNRTCRTIVENRTTRTATIAKRIEIERHFT